MTAGSGPINLGRMLARRPKYTIDWSQELVRQQALQLRHERWRMDSIHVFKLIRKLVIAGLLLHYGIGLDDTVVALISEPENALKLLSEGTPLQAPAP